MNRWLVLLVSLGLALLACSRCGHALVRLNSVNTDGDALPMNKSAWEPRADLKIYQCMSDLECREGNYCHTSSRGPALSRCKTCRKRKRHCLRDTMCCPTNRCSNTLPPADICVPDVDSFVPERIPNTDGELNPLTQKKGGRKKAMKESTGRESTGRGQVGDPCLRSSDCLDGLCCARHFWTRICKPVLREGQVCTRHRHKGNHGLELFQRCSCGDGLTCRTLQERSAQLPPSSSSSSSSLIAAPAGSNLSATSSHHYSVPSSASSKSKVAKTRLHVCQRSK